MCTHNEEFDNGSDNELLTFFCAVQDMANLYNLCNFRLACAFIQLLKFTYNCFSFLK